MIIEIRRMIIEEGFLDTLNNPKDSSSKMNGRADRVSPITDPNILIKRANGFKEDNHELALSKSKRDFMTGSRSGTEMSAKDKFEASRNLELNK